jgi:hypothetical protein
LQDEDEEPLNRREQARRDRQDARAAADAARQAKESKISAYRDKQEKKEKEREDRERAQVRFMVWCGMLHQTASAGQGRQDQCVQGQAGEERKGAAGAGTCSDVLTVTCHTGLLAYNMQKSGCVLATCLVCGVGCASRTQSNSSCRPRMSISTYRDKQERKEKEREERECAQVSGCWLNGGVVVVLVMCNAW